MVEKLPDPTDKVHVFFHEGMLAHNTGYGVFDTLEDPGFLDVLEPHPENADRVRNIRSILRRGPIAPFIEWHQGRRAEIESLTRFHTPGVVRFYFPSDKDVTTWLSASLLLMSSVVQCMGVGEYVEELIAADAAGGKILCANTRLNPGSWEAALLAAGSTQQAMQYLLDGHGRIAYALVRPPGHHAQPTQADGYCFLNNAELAVQLAIDQIREKLPLGVSIIAMGCKRVAVVDIDVHSGNGTAAGFYARDDVLTISLHMNHGSWGPSHPQTGITDEVGQGKGRGFNMNVPLPNGTGDKGYELAMTELVVPAISEFRPNMIVLTIGQDSSAFDPNGRMCLTMEGYRRIGQMVRELADTYTGGRVLVVQEGGYHITYSAYCVHATLEGVLNLPQPLLLDPIAYYPEDQPFSTARIAEIQRSFAKWKESSAEV